MSFLSENVIPGNHGKVFGTNAKNHDDLEMIKTSIEKMKGVKDVILTEDVFPREFVVHTTNVVSIKEIEDTVNNIGFHAIPKSLFAL